MDLRWRCRAVLAGLLLALSFGAQANAQASVQGQSEAGSAASKASETAADTPAGALGDDPRDYLEFTTTLTADCMLHRAQLRQIANTDPQRAIRVVLWSYTGKTRSQGSSEKFLPPKSEPQPLGCDGMSGLKRRWEIESAEFVTTGDAQR